MEVLIALFIGIWMTASAVISYRALRKDFAKEGAGPDGLRKDGRKRNDTRGEN